MRIMGGFYEQKTGKITVALLIVTALGIYYFAILKPRIQARRAADTALKAELSPAEYADYEFAEIKRIDDTWYVTYLPVGHPPAPGTDITVLVTDNMSVEILDSE